MWATLADDIRLSTSVFPQLSKPESITLITSSTNSFQPVLVVTCQVRLSCVLAVQIFPHLEWDIGRFCLKLGTTSQLCRGLQILCVQPITFSPNFTPEVSMSTEFCVLLARRSKKLRPDSALLWRWVQMASLHVFSNPACWFCFSICSIQPVPPLLLIPDCLEVNKRHRHPQEGNKNWYRLQTSKLSSKYYQSHEIHHCN